MKIFNTLTKQKDNFVTIKPNEIKIYVCGQTVYDYCHLGHARKAVVFDMIRRWFIASNYKVTFVENITDIDDKIITRANENGETIYQLTERFIEYMHEDFDRLGVMRPDVQPKATEYIPQMVNLIQGLIAKEFAYLAKNGDVYYRVRKFDGYGKLSGKSLDDLRAGERVEIDSNKEDPLDFVLWKSSKESEPYWDSPFSKGRPGWHIECSAMSEDILGRNFDIHGGGQDLQFPHHENEIAQSEAHNDCQFANYWLHNGFLNINDEKMSKSLGNFFTVREVLKQYKPEIIRFFILSSHYRSPLNYSDEQLNDAGAGLKRLYTALRGYDDVGSDLNKKDLEYNARFEQAMDDDFNTPVAVSVLFDLARELNRVKEEDQKKAHLLVATLKKLASLLGILQEAPESFLKGGIMKGEENTDLLIEQQIQARIDAKKAKDWGMADKIRDDLKGQGVILEDSPNGTTSWRRE